MMWREEYVSLRYDRPKYKPLFSQLLAQYPWAKDSTSLAQVFPMLQLIVKTMSKLH